MRRCTISHLAKHSTTCEIKCSEGSVLGALFGVVLLGFLYSYHFCLEKFDPDPIIFTLLIEILHNFSITSCLLSGFYGFLFSMFIF